VWYIIKGVWEGKLYCVYAPLNMLNAVYTPVFIVYVVYTPLSKTVYCIPIFSCIYSDFAIIIVTPGLHKVLNNRGCEFLSGLWPGMYAPFSCVTYLNFSQFGAIQPYPLHPFLGSCVFISRLLCGILGMLMQNSKVLTW